MSDSEEFCDSDDFVEVKTKKKKEVIVQNEHETKIDQLEMCHIYFDLREYCITNALPILNINDGSDFIDFVQSFVKNRYSSERRSSIPSTESEECSANE